MSINDMMNKFLAMDVMEEGDVHPTEWAGLCGFKVADREFAVYWERLQRPGCWLVRFGKSNEVRLSGSDEQVLVCIAALFNSYFYPDVPCMACGGNGCDGHCQR